MAVTKRFYIQNSAAPNNQHCNMKILIGAPIHEIKNYSIKRWLSSVQNIRCEQNVSYHLLMVDNSQNPEWYKKVHEYCKELNFTNYTLIHLSNMKDGESWEAERLGFSRELLRETVIKESYDYLWSWECDILCPPETLTYLLKFTPEFNAIYHTYPPRGNTIDNGEQDGIGCVLYDKQIFYSFKFVENQTPLGADGRLLFEVLRRGWKTIEIHNVFTLQHIGS